MVIAILVIVAICGAVVGNSLTRFLEEDEIIGTLRLDHSDPDEAPYLFVELEPDGMKKLNEMKVVRMRVEIQDYIPRK